MSTRVFVYGSLKPGKQRWPVLERYVDPDEPPQTDIVTGVLWDTGFGWPAVTRGDGTVPGVVVTIRPGAVDDALAELDEIEGVDRGLFERCTIRTAAGRTCWIYLWPSATDGFNPLHGPW